MKMTFQKNISFSGMENLSKIIRWLLQKKIVLQALTVSLLMPYVYVKCCI